ncbi:MAG: nuclear transport factor 2 family protein [Actinomycetota bacterium]
MTDDSGSALAARLGVLEDIEAIRRLKAAYCAACDDDHDGDAVAALFTQDGVWQQSGDRPRVGRDEIAAKMFGIRDAGFMARSAHKVTNPVIDVDGDTATGQWRFLMMFTYTDGQAFERIIGTYDERYARVEGRWLFTSLMANVEERGRYSAESMPG